MSVEDLKKFGQLCHNDETVRNRVIEIGLQDVQGLMAYGRELGLEFDETDMLDAAKEAGVNVDELSEEQLEKIAGGVVTTTAMVMGALIGIAAMVTTGLVVMTAGAVGAGVLVGISVDGWVPKS